MNIEQIMRELVALQDETKDGATWGNDPEAEKDLRIRWAKTWAAAREALAPRPRRREIPGGRWTCPHCGKSVLHGMRARHPDDCEPVAVQTDKGWLEAAIAWEVCASIHEKYAKGKDAMFTTRHSDFLKHAADSRKNASAVAVQPPKGANTMTPEQKPLTVEQLRECFLATNTSEPLSEGWPGLERFARAVERTHGIGDAPVAVQPEKKP